MSQCEWKDGKLNPCGIMKIRLNDPTWGWRIQEQHKTYICDGKSIFSYCPFCGGFVEYEKPEKPLIVKSGNTWIAFHEGVDYLCVYDPGDYNPATTEERIEMFAYDMQNKKARWIPFIDIKLTDEIALLRPIVKNKDHEPKYYLYGVKNINDFKYIIGEPYKESVTNWRHCELATAKELSNEM